MKTTILVAADLGGFKAFWIDNDEFHRMPRLELLEEYTNPEAHDHQVDRFSDLSGRFPRSTGTGRSNPSAMSDGERHNIERELRKRLVRKIARRLGRLLREDQIDRCYLAASREINHQLLEELDPGARIKIERNLPADLTKTDKAELLGYFQPPTGRIPPGQRPML